MVLVVRQSVRFSCEYRYPAEFTDVDNRGIGPVYCWNSANSMSIWTLDECILWYRCRYECIPHIWLLDPGIPRGCPLWCWGIDGLVMARCHGQLPVSTKVDQEMLDYINESAEEAGVSRSEFIRRMMDLYRHIDQDGECPECGATLHVKNHEFQ